MVKLNTNIHLKIQLKVIELKLKTILKTHTLETKLRTKLKYIETYAKNGNANNYGMKLKGLK